MYETFFEELNYAVDLNVFAMDYEKYDDSQLDFEEDNTQDDESEQTEISEKEEPYTAY